MKNESNHDKFVRLSVDRANKFKDQCNLISNLSDKRYGYDENDVRYYLGQVESMLEQSKILFARSRRKAPDLKFDQMESMLVAKSMQPRDHKHEAFHRLMTIRCNRLVLTINQLINLANLSNYAFYGGEITALFAFLNQVLDRTGGFFIRMPDFSYKNYVKKNSDDEDEENDRERYRR